MNQQQLPMPNIIQVKSVRHGLLKSYGQKTIYEMHLADIVIDDKGRVIKDRSGSVARMATKEELANARKVS